MVARRLHSRWFEFRQIRDHALDPLGLATFTTE